MPKGPKPAKKNNRKARLNAENAALTAQTERIEELKSASSTDLANIQKFEDLPLSQPTQAGLKASHFTQLTDIQREGILPILQKNDILAAARTGSGKTLAFLVPLLDRLYLDKWTQMDGLGALIITPTRELALQIFEVLRNIGRKHTFSAGLLIGGKNVQAEKERVGKLNILVATPGRLLQHMDESPAFDASNLQLLVLDEADRIMDMGFKRTVDAIVQNLPPQRQTLLFSATQTKNVSDLARLSLKKPKYISVVDPETSREAGVDSNAKKGGLPPTPKTLEQFYMVVPLAEKLDLLWSFLRSHTKNKILVFFASSKQVRFVYESFRRMQPGIPLMHLHGRQKQTSRTETTTKFMRSRASCLFATDVVARGIDFPEIDWVIQVDCPEDVATYIHRVGRSARAGKSGRALLMLTPSEKPAFVSNLEARRIPISEINVNDTKKSSIRSELQAQLFQDPELKYLAQKAFISYMRSVHIQRDKQVFDVTKVPLEALANSFGLASAPNVKIKGNLSASKDAKNKPRALVERPVASSQQEVRTKYDRIFQRQNQNVLSEHYQKLAPGEEEASDEEGGFMNIKRQDHDLESEAEDDESDNDEKAASSNNEVTSKRALKKALSKKQSLLSSKKTSTKLVFDDEGEAHPIYEFDTEADFQSKGLPEDQRQEFVANERGAMEERDVEDKEVVRQRLQEKKRRRKELERLAREGELSDSEGGAVARLPSDNEYSGDDEESNRAENEARPNYYDDISDSDDGMGREVAEFSEEEDESPKRPASKKQKRRHTSDVLEVDEPETLEDLEALSSRLLGH